MAVLMSKNVFSGGQQVLDGVTYQDCVFEQVKLIYRGGPPPTLNGCRFDGCQFVFEGPALNTINFLKALAGPTSGLQVIVRDTFPELFE